LRRAVARRKRRPYNGSPEKSIVLTVPGKLLLLPHFLPDAGQLPLTLAKGRGKFASEMTESIADLPSPGLQSPMEWLLATLSIVLIDIVLAGDNAVVIALAVRRLEKRERMWGILIGSGMAVILRVGLTFVAAQLLSLNYIKLIGGLLILWIAVKLLVDNTGAEEGKGEAQNLWQAVWFITVADITMSLDNVLAVAGASKGSFGLLLFGLGLSIPLVVFTSSLLAKLMDRYPVIIYIGSAILGKVAADMILSDRLIEEAFHPTPWLVHGAEAVLAAGVIGVALILRRWKRPTD
jgi:YjbE family integral membrane protein